MGVTNFFNNFGVDIGCLLVACVIVAIVSLLKSTILKNHAQSPFLTFLPFLLGILLYAGYYGVLRIFMSGNGLLVTLDGILQQGFTSGCFATVISAFVDKCFGKTTLGGRALVVRKLLEGFVEEGKLDQTAKRIASTLPDDLTESDTVEANAVKKVTTVLMDYQKNRTDGMESSSMEMEVLARLIVATLQKTT